MKLTVDTIDILKNFQSLFPSLLIEAGNVIHTVTTANTVTARADLKQTFENDVSIYDLGNFISVLSMFKDAEIDTSEEGCIKISSPSTGAIIKYRCSDPGLMVKPRQPPLYDESNVGIEFFLTKDVLEEVRKAVNILGLSDIGIIGDGSELSIQALSSARKNEASDEYKNNYKKVLGTTDKEFKVFIRNENFKIMSDDYYVMVRRAIAGKGGHVHFKNDKNTVRYWIAIEDGSYF